MRTNSKRGIVQFLLVAIYVTLLVIPGWIFFSQRGGIAFLGSFADFQAGLRLLFPLFGLYAFTLVAMQAMIGPNISLLRKYFPKIREFHRYEGTFALLFVILHPVMIVAGFGLGDYFGFNYVSPDLIPFLIPAYTAFTIILITAGSAILAWRGKRITWWRWVHRFNYLAFILVWIHSWFIGTDIQTTSLRYIWLFYLVIVLASFARVYLPKAQKLLFADQK